MLEGNGERYVLKYATQKIFIYEVILICVSAAPFLPRAYDNEIGSRLFDGNAWYILLALSSVAAFLAIFRAPLLYRAITDRPAIIVNDHGFSINNYFAVSEFKFSDVELYTVHDNGWIVIQLSDGRKISVPLHLVKDGKMFLDMLKLKSRIYSN